MKEINGSDKQKTLVQIVLDEKEVSLLINDIEELTYDETKYKNFEKFEYDRKTILETPWDVSAVLQNKRSKISEIVEYNLQKNGIKDVSVKKIFTALRAKYKSSSKVDDNERAERI